METIVTERLVLRTLQYSDVPFIQRSFNEDPFITADLRPEYKHSSHGAYNYVSLTDAPTLASARVVAFMIYDQQDVPMGAIMFNASRDDNAWYIGFWLVQKYRGHGYMHEAVTAATAWVFANLCYSKVMASTASANGKSLRITESHGFEITAIEHMEDGSRRAISTVTPETFIVA